MIFNLKSNNIIMKLEFIIIFIIFILSIIASGYNKKNEYFESCIINQYQNKNKFTPINMIIQEDDDPYNSDNKNQLINNNSREFVFTAEELKYLLDKYPLVPVKNEYYEVQSFKYTYFEKTNYYKLSIEKSSKMITNLFNKIKLYLDNNSNSKLTICNVNTPCILKLIDSKILRVGESKKDTLMIEGQILLEYVDRSVKILINFVISDEESNSDISIHKLKLEGYELISDKLASNSIELKSNYLELDTNNVFSKYKGNLNDKTTPNRRGILLTDNQINQQLNEREYNQKINYKCYGKDEINKLACESIYDRFGNKLENVGVWDYECIKDEECPFFKSNKNYPNEFGKCVNGKCQLPVGITQISPHKFLNEDKAICYNCKGNNINCCKEQINPDYKFENDMDERIKNTELLKSKNLSVQ